MIHRVVCSSISLVVGALCLGGCFVESRPDPVVYSPGYGYTTVAAPGTTYYTGGYYDNRYYQPGYYQPSAPFFAGRAAVYARPGYVQPGYVQPGYAQPVYRAPEYRGNGYVGTPIGSVRGAVEVR